MHNYNHAATALSVATHVPTSLTSKNSHTSLFCSPTPRICHVYPVGPAQSHVLRPRGKEGWGSQWGLKINFMTLCRPCPATPAVLLPPGCSHPTMPVGLASQATQCTVHPHPRSRGVAQFTISGASASHNDRHADILRHLAGLTSRCTVHVEKDQLKIPRGNQGGRSTGGQDSRVDR